MKTTQKGFTLIELMIAVAIIGLLAAIALPTYQDYVKRAYVTEALALASGAKASVTEYRSDKGEWPASNLQVGLVAPASIKGNAVHSVSVGSSGVITIALHMTKIAPGNVILTPSQDSSAASSVNWTCSGTIPQKYLPANCRP